jgi:hypothetical protein
MSKTEDFKTCTETLTEDRRLAAFDQELVLRFFAFRNDRDNFKHDVADFLTEYMEGVSETEEQSRIPFDYNEQRAAFLKTFHIFGLTLGPTAFSFANRSRDDLTKSFSVYHFEAFTVGIQSQVNAIDDSDDDLLQRLAEEFKAIKLDPQFIRITTGGGKNSPGPLNERIGFVENRIQKIL